MKRWIAAIIAVLFLSTSTLHVLVHSDLNEGVCAVCHTQTASHAAAPAPAVVSAPIPSSPLAQSAVPRAVAASPVPGIARAPPADRA